MGGLADPFEHELKARTPVQQPGQRMDHHARRAFKASGTNLVGKQLWARRAVWVTHIPSPVERVRAAIREKRTLWRIGRQAYTTITYDDHDPLGLDEEAAHRFRTKWRWHLVTSIVESAGFYQLPDSVQPDFFNGIGHGPPSEPGTKLMICAT